MGEIIIAYRERLEFGLENIVNLSKAVASFVKRRGDDVQEMISGVGVLRAGKSGFLEEPEHF